MSGSEGRLLRLMNNIEDPLHAIARFAQNESASDIRLIAFDQTAIVDHHDGIFTDLLWRGRAVRQSAILAHFDTCLARNPTRA